MIVTGGAGAAGAAAVRLFTLEGASVAIFDIDVDRGHALAEELRSNGSEASFHQVDVADERSVASGVAEVEREFGGIEILFNHAGSIYTGRLHEMSLEDWDRVNAINVTSMFLTCRAVLPKMIEQQEGTILNTSSISGLTANPYGIAYCTGKGAILQFTRGVAVEYRGYGIRCNAICPGFMASPHSDRERSALDALGEPVSDADIAKMQGRICQPEEFARAALSLVSSDSTFVNGAHLVVDNGWMALS